MNEIKRQNRLLNRQELLQYQEDTKDIIQRVNKVHQDMKQLVREIKIQTKMQKTMEFDRFADITYQNKDFFNKKMNQNIEQNLNPLLANPVLDSVINKKTDKKEKVNLDDAYYNRAKNDNFNKPNIRLDNEDLVFKIEKVETTLVPQDKINEYEDKLELLQKELDECLNNILENKTKKITFENQFQELDDEKKAKTNFNFANNKYGIELKSVLSEDSTEDSEIIMPDFNQTLDLMPDFNQVLDLSNAKRRQELLRFEELNQAFTPAQENYIQ